MALKENYKDDILDVSVNTKRKYRMTENPDGTISLEDETVYTQQGDSFGASDMNATNGKVNTLESDIGEINDNLNGFTFYPAGEVDLVASVSDDSYYTDANGKYVLADSTTGQSLIDDVTYKSLASIEDLRGKVGADTVSPFKNKVFITNYPSTYKYQGELSAGGTATLTIPNNISYLVFVSEQYFQRLAVYDTKSRKFLFLGCMINIYPINTNYQILGNTLKVTNQSSNFKVWYMGI